MIYKIILRKNNYKFNNYAKMIKIKALLEFINNKVSFFFVPFWSICQNNENRRKMKQEENKVSGLKLK